VRFSSSCDMIAIATIMPPLATPANSGFDSYADIGTKDARALEQDQSRREDEELVSRAQTGDATAFDALVIKYSPRLYALVYNMTSNHDDTNDLLQDVWAKAFRSVGGFRGKSQFYTWLHSIGANMTINFLKKRGRRKTMSLDDVDNGLANDKEFAELKASSTPVRDTDLGELQKKINEAMMKPIRDKRRQQWLADQRTMRGQRRA